MRILLNRRESQPLRWLLFTCALPEPLVPVSLVTSKQRFAGHGKVFAPAWMVEDVLGLVKNDTQRIDSRFPGPACGNGNFLVQVLRCKLAAWRCPRDEGRRRRANSPLPSGTAWAKPNPSGATSASTPCLFLVLAHRQARNLHAFQDLTADHRQETESAVTA